MPRKSANNLKLTRIGEQFNKPPIRLTSWHYAGALGVVAVITLMVYFPVVRQGVGLAIIMGLIGWALYSLDETGAKKDQRQLFPLSMMDAKVMEYARKGYLVVSRSNTQVQMLKKKEFSFAIALLGLLTWGAVTVLYIFWYMAKKDEIVTLTFSKHAPKHL